MYSFTSECFFWCWTSDFLWANDFWHISQVNDSPKWLRQWSISDLSLTYDLVHRWHLNDRMVECFLCWCSCMLSFVKKDKPQCSQVKGLIPSCLSLWPIRLPFELKEFPHTSQTNSFFPEWIFMWAHKFLLWWKLLLQLSHENSLGLPSFRLLPKLFFSCNSSKTCKSKNYHFIS